MWLVHLLDMLHSMAWLMALGGAIALILGLRGRSLPAGPRCRKCEYDLTGLTSERCPECGNVIAETGVVHVRRQRRRGAIVLSVLLLLPSVAVLVSWPKVLQYKANVYPNLPTSWLLSDCRSADPDRSRIAYWQLLRRLQAGELDNAQVAALKANALALYADTSGGMPFVRKEARSILRLLIRRGQLTAAETSALFESLVDIRMRSRPKALRLVGVRVELNVVYGRSPVLSQSPLVRIVDPNADSPASLPAKTSRPTPDLDSRETYPTSALRSRAHRAYRAGPSVFGGPERQTWLMAADHIGLNRFVFEVSIDFRDRGRLVHRVKRRCTVESVVSDAWQPGEVAPEPVQFDAIPVRPAPAKQ